MNFLYFFLLYPFSAFADNQPSNASNEGVMILFIGVCFFVVMYFVTIRPENKRAKALKVIRDNLSKGDEVIILNGILAVVVNIKDQWVVVSISDNCEIVIQKNAIVQEVPKGTMKSKLAK